MDLITTTNESAQPSRQFGEFVNKFRASLNSDNKSTAFIEVTEAIRDFASTEHLNPEAVAAFVDNELSPGAAHRARIHLVHCSECRVEVDRQRRAAKRLREARAEDVKPSSDLLQRLQKIATSCPDGPCAEESIRGPETLLDKLDLVARALRKHNNGGQ